MSDPAPDTTLPAKREPKAIDKVRDLLMRAKPEIAMALPRHLTPDRLLRVSMTAVQKTPALLECDRISLLGAVMQAAQLGLEPDGVLGHAYLVPIGQKVHLWIGYKGLIALARRSGEITSIAAHVVYSHDQFSYAYGLEDRLVHVPAAGVDRGVPLYTYAVARFKDGGHAFEVMSEAQIEEIRKTSKQGDSGPWKTARDEMRRKTAIRRLAKYLPLSVEFQRAASLSEDEPQDVEDLDPTGDAYAAAMGQDAEERVPSTKRLTDELAGKSPKDIGREPKA